MHIVYKSNYGMRFSRIFFKFRNCKFRNFSRLKKSYVSIFNKKVILKKINKAYFLIKY